MVMEFWCRDKLLLFSNILFRVTSVARDLWRNLERNWLHFFWLTGETPNSLAHLVNVLENEFFPYMTAGRNPILNTRNQVPRR